MISAPRCGWNQSVAGSAAASFAGFADFADFREGRFTVRRRAMARAYDSDSDARRAQRTYGPQWVLYQHAYWPDCGHATVVLQAHFPMSTQSPKQLPDTLGT